MGGHVPERVNHVTTEKRVTRAFARGSFASFLRQFSSDRPLGMLPPGTRMPRIEMIGTLCWRQGRLNAKPALSAQLQRQEVCGGCRMFDTASMPRMRVCARVRHYFHRQRLKAERCEKHNGKWCKTYKGHAKILQAVKWFKLPRGLGA